MKNLIIYIIICFTVNFVLQAAEEEQGFTDKEYRTTFYFNAGGSVYTGGNKFFDVYNGIIEGKKTGFTKTPMLGGGVKVKLFKNFRLNVSFDYLFAELYEYYNQVIDTGDNPRSRNIEQLMNLRELPVCAGFEFIPTEGPYRTFVGAQIGFNIGRFTWSENINSQLPYDKRTGGNYGYGMKINPVFRINTGVELAFDLKHPNYILNRLIFELRYTFIYRKEKVFSDLQDQFNRTIPEFNREYFIVPGLIEFKLGVSIDLSRLEN